MPDMYDLYSNGLKGAIYDEGKANEFLATLKYPFFKDVNTLFKDGKDKLSLPWKAAQKFHPKFGEDDPQKTGDCVSHGNKNGADITRSFEILYNGEKESFIARGATEGIYGSRGSSGEGMFAHQAVEFLTKTGGVLVRKNYKEVGIDLTNYDAKKGIGWGRSGVPEKLLAEARKNQFQTASLVQTTEEARDLLANGYGIPVCSNYGFGNKRDKFGIAEPHGTWHHCMEIGGCDDTKKRHSSALFLIINSWGPDWINGPKFEQPEGSFWITEDVMAAMIAQKQTYALSNFDGFRRRMDWSRIKEIYQ